MFTGCTKCCKAFGANLCWTWFRSEELITPVWRAKLFPFPTTGCNTGGRSQKCWWWLNATKVSWIFIEIFKLICLNCDHTPFVSTFHWYSVHEVSLAAVCRHWSQHGIGMSVRRNQTLHSHVGKKKGQKKNKKKKLWEIFRALFNSNWRENWALGVAVDFVMGLEAEVPSTKRAIATKTK